MREKCDCERLLEVFVEVVEENDGNKVVVVSCSRH